jgi:tRNA A37 threonylcarbamoyladenosine biosynthesis protein TsaE
MKSNEILDKEDTELSFPKYIDSSPPGHDLLEGQSQEKIADSISILISSDRAASKLVGIDGPWGSGKSNLVKIIEGKLKETHHTFLYDAWGHQEDLHRRAFLEELTEDLCKNEVISKIEWEGKLKELLARRKETTTKTIPRLSNGVVVAFFVAILTPLASTIADSVSDNSLKIFISSLPLVLGILVWAVGSIRRKKVLSFQDVFYLYNEKDLVNEVHEIISEKQPSVREFQNWIYGLSESLSEKKLIIVFDNMDRLPPEKVKGLWSSIHTFFAEKTLDNIWVIIPFDRNHITTVFDNEDVAENFLNKTFSLIYYVSPPVLTDWQKFYNDRFSEAFGPDNLDSLGISRRIFDLFNRDITPRKIITYINELVSLRLIAPKNIQLKYIAIFICSKKLILKSPIDQILSLEFLGRAESLFRGDKDLQNNISALVYQVPLSSASQVSLTREIETSLHEQNDSRFNELSKHLHFMDILEQVFNEDIENTDDIDNPIVTLSQLDKNYVKNNDLESRISALWETLCRRALRESIQIQELTAAQQLLVINSPKATSAEFVKHFVIGVRNVESFSGARYFSALFDLKEIIEQNEIEIDLVSMLTPLEKPPQIFLDYVKAAGDHFNLFNLTCNEARLNKYLVERVPNNLSGLAYIAVTRNKYDYGSTIESIEKSITDGAITSENFASTYELYSSLSIETLKLPPDNVINSLLQSMPENYELHAMRLSRTSDFPNFGGITESLLNNTDDAKVKKVAKRIQRYNFFGALLVKYVSWQKPLLKSVLRELILGQTGNRMNITQVIKHFTALFHSLDIEPVVLLKCLDSWSKYADKITDENIADHIPNHEYFEHSAALGLDLTNHTDRTIVAYLNNRLTIDDWRAAFHNVSSYDFIVTRIMLGSEVLKALPDDAISAYKEILLEAARGEVQLSDEHGWNIFYEKTNKNKLKPTAKNIRDLYISEVNVTPPRFIAVSDLLINHSSMEKRSADVTRRILAPVVDDQVCLDIMLKNPEYIAEIVNAAGDDASDFKDKIRQIVSASEHNETLLSFARNLDIEIETEKKDRSE